MSENTDLDAENPDGTLSALLEVATEPLYAVDADAQFEVVNGAFEELTGYDRAELVGREGETILHEEDRDEWTRRVQLVCRGGLTEVERWSARIVSKHGTEIPTEWEFSAVQEAETCVVGRARDVREGQRREQKLNILNRALRHNIRNQMNIVIGKAHGLQEVDDDGYRAMAEKIEEIGENVVNISDKARKAQEHVGLPPDEACRTELVGMVERVVTKFAITYPAATVETALPSSAWARAPPSVEVALVELLENAVIHHPSGEGAVTVTVTDDDKSVDVRVRDECAPIPDQVQRTISRGAEQPLHHNDGLGLWIVRWVADSVDARLSFQRRADGAGNEVVLSFDRVPA